MEKKMTTIAISEKTKDELKQMKTHSREPFEEVLQRILKRINELTKEGIW